MLLDRGVVLEEATTGTHHERLHTTVPRPPFRNVVRREARWIIHESDEDDRDDAKRVQQGAAIGGSWAGDDFGNAFGRKGHGRNRWKL